jgi:hypothetical protein
MKVFNTVLAGALLLAAPAFADSVTVQTQSHENSGVVVSPPVAAVPVAPSKTIEHDKIKQSDDGMQREEKRTQETVTPNGSSRTTVKTKTDLDD